MTLEIREELVKCGYDAISQSFSDDDVSDAVYVIAEKHGLVDSILSAEKDGVDAVADCIMLAITKEKSDRKSIWKRIFGRRSDN
jgi:hypothetical protein